MIAVPIITWGCLIHPYDYALVGTLLVGVCIGYLLRRLQSR